MFARILRRTLSTASVRRLPTVKATDGAEFNQIVSKAGNKLVVVDFYADWCAPCKAIAPVFASLSDQHKDVVFVKVNVDENEQTTMEYNVNAMPTFLFLKNGQVVRTLVGADVRGLKDGIAQLGSVPAAAPHA